MLAIYITKILIEAQNYLQNVDMTSFGWVNIPLGVQRLVRLFCHGEEKFGIRCGWITWKQNAIGEVLFFEDNLYISKFVMFLFIVEKLGGTIIFISISIWCKFIVLQKKVFKISFKSEIDFLFQIFLYTNIFC